MVAMSMAKSSKTWATCFVLAWLAAGALEARAADRQGGPLIETGVYDRVRELLLYQNDRNPTVQSLVVVGRYHGQYAAVDADQGSADEWENRRIFLGLEAQLYHRLTVHAQIRTSEDLHPFYDGFYQLFAQWSPTKAQSWTAGRLDFLYNGLERSTSSNRIVTIERSQLADQTMPGEVVGAVFENRGTVLSYRLGILSGTIDDEFSDFSGGAGVVADVDRKLPLGYESGELHLDYLWNDGNSANNALPPYDHHLSLWHQGRAGPWEVGNDVTWAHGLDGRPSVFGLTVIPTRTFAGNLLRKGDALQAVLRYQFSVSDGHNGLALQNRYEQHVVSGGAGDHYMALYAGINYRIIADRLKLMTGVERSSMKDAAHDGGQFDGWTYFTGVRVFF